MPINEPDIKLSTIYDEKEITKNLVFYIYKK